MSPREPWSCLWAQVQQDLPSSPRVSPKGARKFLEEVVILSAGRNEAQEAVLRLDVDEALAPLNPTQSIRHENLPVRCLTVWRKVRIVPVFLGRPKETALEVGVGVSFLINETRDWW